MQRTTAIEFNSRQYVEAEMFYSEKIFSSKFAFLLPHTYTLAYRSGQKTDISKQGSYVT